MKLRIYHLLIYCFLWQILGACFPLPTNTSGNTTGSANGVEKIFTTENYIYEPNIKTIQFYPVFGDGDNNQLQILPPTVHLNQTSSLQLTFDGLGNKIESYRYKLMHCDYNWKPSSLNDIEFLNDYNDFPITKYQTSINTRVPYTHYLVQIPKLKLSGNYLLVVYKNSDPNDLVLTRRFIVYENKLGIEPIVKFSTNNSLRDKNHQIEFKVTYKGYQVFNPREDIKIVIRQNARWDNAIFNLKPLHLRDFDQTLEYTHFNLENNFSAYNEFRRFDTRSIRFLGFNVANITTTDTLVSMRLSYDSPRDKMPYFRQPDFNGAYKISHYETGRGEIESDYIKVKFCLKTPVKFDHDVYVVGDFNNWQPDNSALMTYSLENQQYTADILLKQGEYNYYYAERKTGEKNLRPEIFEGSFTETENNYEIIAYHRPPAARADMIVGYIRFNSNERR